MARTVYPMDLKESLRESKEVWGEDADMTRFVTTYVGAVNDAYYAGVEVGKKEAQAV